MPENPLFAEHSAPSIIAAMAGTDAGDGTLDVAKLVGLMASRRFARSLPRRPRPSLFRGLQLLVDIGEAMMPFRKDTISLRRQVESLVGRPGVQCRYFADSPLAGIGAGGRWTWADGYQPPDIGTPVLVATDLGIGGPISNPRRSMPADWLRIADFLRRRSSSLVVLVPYDRHRWPVSLHGRIPIVQWDRVTTMATVRAAVGSVLGGPRD